MGLQGLLVPVHADVAHPGGGNHPQHAVHQAQARPEDGHHGELLALQRGGDGLADGGLHLLGGQGQVPGGLVGDQHPDLGDDLPEILDAGVLVPQDGQLVGHQGVVHDVYFTAHHSITPF